MHIVSVLHECTCVLAIEMTDSSDQLETQLHNFINMGQWQRASKISYQLLANQPTILEWVEQVSNYASFDNQSGLYDEVAEYIRKL